MRTVEVIRGETFMVDSRAFGGGSRRFDAETLTGLETWEKRGFPIHGQSFYGCVSF